MNLYNPCKDLTKEGKKTSCKCHGKTGIDCWRTFGNNKNGANHDS